MAGDCRKQRQGGRGRVVTDLDPTACRVLLRGGMSDTTVVTTVVMRVVKPVRERCFFQAVKFFPHFPNLFRSGGMLRRIPPANSVKTQKQQEGGRCQPCETGEHGRGTGACQ